MIPAKTLGEKIHELRSAQNLSMRDLAAKAKLRSPAFIADLERGFRYPSSEVLANLAAALEVSTQDLQAHDRRAPLQEIRDLAETNHAWAAALRKMVESAQSGVLTPAALNRLVDSYIKENADQKTLPLWK